MTYAPNMNSISPRGGAYAVDQKEIERVLRNLMARQSGGIDEKSAGRLLDAVQRTSF